MKNKIKIILLALCLYAGNHLLSGCSIANTSQQTCVIKEIVEISEMNSGRYFVLVVFSNCASQSSRKELVKKEIIKKYPAITQSDLAIDEYLGKMYNEYKYEILVK